MAEIRLTMAEIFLPVQSTLRQMAEIRLTMAEIPLPMAEIRLPIQLTLRQMAETFQSVKPASPSSKDYSLADLQRLTSYSSRNIYRYMDMGLVPRPRHAGSQTRYSRHALGRLLAIAKLRREDKYDTADVEDALRALTDEEAEAYAEACDPLRPVAVATPPAPTPKPAPRDVDAGPVSIELSGPTAPTPAPPAGVPQRWVRIALVPGLELMVYEGGGELVARLAQEIVTKYAANAPS
jgi:hypothetical protein